MGMSPSIVRVFPAIASPHDSRPIGDQQIAVATAVDKSEGGALSAYSARFARGATASLPAPYEEVWVVASGQIRIANGDAGVIVGPGGFVHVPEASDGTVEALEDATLVCVSVPAH